MATMAASESSFSSETDGSSSKGASGKSQVSGKKVNILYLNFITYLLMPPCPSTGPKRFWAGPNYLGQS